MSPNQQTPNATRERLLRRAAELAGQQAEVARLLADLDSSERTTERTTYSSLDLPPDLAQAPAGRRTFREWCAAGLVDGAEKAGNVWFCSVAAWRQARIKTPSPRPRFVPEAEAPPLSAA